MTLVRLSGHSFIFNMSRVSEWRGSAWGGGRWWGGGGSRPQPPPDSLLTPMGSHYFRAPPLPPLCFSVLNNFPTCHATCSPVAAGNSVAKTITADIVTLSWHLLPHLFPTLPMGTPAVSHPPPPLALPNLVSGTWRSGWPASRGGTDTRGISPTLPSLPSGPNKRHPPARQVHTSLICGRF